MRTPEQERMFVDWHFVVDTLLDAYDMHRGLNDAQHEEMLQALYHAPHGLRELLTALAADYVNVLRAGTTDVDAEKPGQDPFIWELVARSCARAGCDYVGLGAAYSRLAYSAFDDADTLVSTYATSAKRNTVAAVAAAESKQGIEP